MKGILYIYRERDRERERERERDIEIVSLVRRIPCQMLAKYRPFKTQ